MPAVLPSSARFCMDVSVAVTWSSSETSPRSIASTARRTVMILVSEAG